MSTHVHLHIHVHKCMHVHTYTQKKFILLWGGHASFPLRWYWAAKHSAHGSFQNPWRTCQTRIGWLSRAFSRLSPDVTALRALADLKKNGNGFWNIESQCLLPLLGCLHEEDIGQKRSLQSHPSKYKLKISVWSTLSPSVNTHSIPLSNYTIQWLVSINFFPRNNTCSG